MRIWIDGYEANVLERLGSSQVAFELIKNLQKVDHQNQYTIVLPNSPMDDLPKEREGWKYKILKPGRFWTRIVLPWALYFSKIKPDLIFSPTHYIPRFSPVKRVVTIFDLSFLHFPEKFTSKDLWQLKDGTKYSVENADHIITISNSSKKDIVAQYRVDKNKITVVYPGYDKEKFKVLASRSHAKGGRSGQNSKFKIEQIKKRYEIDSPYIMYIGTIQPRKNIVRLIDAVSRIENLNLVIVGKTKGFGKEGWMFEEILERPKQLGIEEKVKFLGYVPSEDLPSLLSGAVAFVLPSLWEGFGLPVLEAMACGTPVLVSNVSSLPEVCGKAGLTFDPYSVDQIEQAIRTIVTDTKLRQRYSKEALKRAKKFSWGKMAKEVLKVFEKA